MDQQRGSREISTFQNVKPTTLDKRDIIWDGNPAHILGVLHDVGEYFERTHQFKPLFAHRAAVTSSGKLAVPSKASIPFVIELVTEAQPYTFSRPCPVIEDRISAHNTSVPAARRYHTVVRDIDQVAIDNKDVVIIQPHLVDLELGRLHETLIGIINDPSVAKTLAQTARGDGIALLDAMRLYATKAKESDKSLVINNYNLSSSKAIDGPLTLASLDDWVTDYERAKSFVPATSRKNDASEVEMINLIAFRDTSVQKTYELDFRAASTPPATMADALELLRSILRSREVYEKITGGVTSSATSKLLDPSPSQSVMMAMMLKTQQALISAINQGALVKPDPSKNTGGAHKSKSGGTMHRDLPPVPHPNNDKWAKPDRDKNGQLTEWKKGMEPCRLCFKELNQRCEHLFRDCPRRGEDKAAKSNTFKHDANAATQSIPDVIDSQSLSNLLAQFSAEALTPSGEAIDQYAFTAAAPGSHVPAPVYAQASEQTDSNGADSHVRRCKRAPQHASRHVRPPGLAPVSTSITDRLWSKVLRSTSVNIDANVELTTNNKFTKLSTAHHCTPNKVLPSKVQFAATHSLHVRELTRALPVADSPPPPSNLGKFDSLDQTNATLHAYMVKQAPSHFHRSHDQRLFKAGIDSCCTNHATPNRSLLINIRPCDETFVDANGNNTTCTIMGDMPVAALSTTGVVFHFTIKDVIHAPSFKHTLISVDQLWEQQHIQAVFGGSRHLVFNDKTVVKFSARSKQTMLPTVAFFSLASVPSVQQSALISHAAGSLGFHSVTASSHTARMSSARLGELMHRRLHVGIDKIRAAAHTTTDGPRNLASVPQSSCVHCAKAHITRASHPSSLRAPAAEPGVIHVDLIDMANGSGRFNYAALFVDEYSRYAFIRFLRRKSDVEQASKEVVAEFASLVGTRSDENGTLLPRPKFRRFHGDHEGSLESTDFNAYKADTGVHHTFSPPNDHDLNPIAERSIRAIRELASAIKSHSNAPLWTWPWLFAHAVDIHNCTIGSVGSSPAHESITPYQRFTLRPPRIMDLATFGCKAVAYLPPPQHQKRSLSPRGVEGVFLGRSRRSIGSYEVYSGGKIITTSSVLIDEEMMPWWVGDEHRPISAIMGGTPSAPRTPLQSETGVPITSFDSRSERTPMLDSPLTQNEGRPQNEGHRPQHEGRPQNEGQRGIGAVTRAAGDTDRPLPPTRAPPPPGRLLNLFSGPYGGTTVLRAKLEDRGWAVDQIDSDKQLGGGWADNILNDACFQKLLDDCRASKYDAVMLAPPCSTFSISRLFKLADGSSGAPPVRSSTHPDGLPPDQLPAAHTMELKRANIIINRMVDIAIAAHHSSSKATIILENPADRNEEGSPAHDETFKEQGSLFNTSYFKRLMSHVHLKHVTFAYCRLGVNIQKYTSLYYSSDASSVLDKLGGRDFQCNHKWGSHDKIGGVRDENGRYKTASSAAYPEQLNIILADAFTAAYQNRPSTEPSRPLSTTDCQSHSMPSTVRPTELPPPTQVDESPPVETTLLPSLNVDPHPDTFDPSSVNFDRQHPTRRRTPPDRLLIDDTSSKSYNTAAAYVAEEAVAALVHTACMSNMLAKTGYLTPITKWCTVSNVPPTAKKFAHNRWMDESESHQPKLTTADQNPHSACRADSAGAPATHAQAADDPRWVEAEKGELENHRNNGSFTVLDSNQVPSGRRIHKLVWVYKVKRDGTFKARLCVQGCTMEKGIDYDQVFSASLRYSSARAIFAHAARMGYHLRSVDLTAAYLQGAFVEGEVVYCKMPPGYEERDRNNKPRVIRVDKPIYGIPQSGRRLQRPLVQWFRSHGFLSLDDADPCVFVKRGADQEIIIVGCYVDNLQIASSSPYDEDGHPPKGSILAEFLDDFAKDWDIVDEGPIDDLLGIEVRRNDDMSITIHQSSYISKMVDRFMPDGIPSHVQRNSVPYSNSFLMSMNEALSPDAEVHADLVNPFQQRIGSLMYCCTATRPDVTYVVNQLCKCMQRPTPALMLETDHVMAYLFRSRDIGLTFERGDTGKLRAFSDASWETHRSVSGWTVHLGRALISWGSKTQKCTALSSAEAELIALSDATKEVVYQRKWFQHISPNMVDEPTLLSTDNKAARDTAYNPEHFDRMKHVARRHFFVRDMVEEMQISVPLVRTDVNVADFLTKPLAPKVFYRLRAAVMNERRGHPLKPNATSK